MSHETISRHADAPEQEMKHYAVDDTQPIATFMEERRQHLEQEERALSPHAVLEGIVDAGEVDGVVLSDMGIKADGLTAIAVTHEKTWLTPNTLQVVNENTITVLRALASVAKGTAPADGQIQLDVIEPKTGYASPAISLDGKMDAVNRAALDLLYDRLDLKYNDNGAALISHPSEDVSDHVSVNQTPVGDSGLVISEVEARSTILQGYSQPLETTVSEVWLTNGPYHE